ncbi:formylmethanofuran dehydrogenase [bacterium]|nr:formylmethanofuran dehydrogenase [bacterium]
MTAYAQSFEDVVRFHGHACPGLALGYRMAKAALERLSAERADDEEIVAISENDSCAVDALQCLSGCTFGKGNLIYRDYGKMVFTIYHRQSGKAVRVKSSRRQDDMKLAGMGLTPQSRDEMMQWMLTGPEDDVIVLEDVHIPEPERAKIVDSVRCAGCGELVMETRARLSKGEPLCPPCFEARGAV